MLYGSNIRFVLVNTTHPGNIGSAARAIKNMGFDKLYLVSPRYFPHHDAFARSSGAEDILENAVVVSSLPEAIADCHLIFGTSSRERALPIPLLSARASADYAHSFVSEENKTAIIFGQERIGLTNEELSLCHFHVYIPCSSQFSSLNIASAVQIIAYEFHLKMVSGEVRETKSAPLPLATSHQLEQFYQHLESTLITLKFLNTENPRQVMKKIRRLFGRTQVEMNELNILRGILAAIKKKETANG